MALKGNLKDFSLTQLLNLVNLASKTGTLEIEGNNETASLIFKEGKLAYVSLKTQDNSLPAILLRGKKLSPAQYQIVVDQFAGKTDKELGLMLINAGYLNQKEIIESLKQYFIMVIRELFTWLEGFFQFELDIHGLDSRIPVRMELENLIIEGSRQKREWEHLQEEIPSLEMALKFADRPGADIQKVNLSVDEWRVVSYVNPKNTMRQIERAIKMNDLEIRRAVFSLLQAGLVEIVRPGGGAAVISREKMFPTSDPGEQKNMLNKLITRIRTI
jgi:hypothetical protein